MHAVVHALSITGSMTWEITWALILGFALSAVIQAVVRRSTIVRLLGDARPRTWASTRDQDPFLDEGAERLTARQRGEAGRAGQCRTAGRGLTRHQQARRDLDPDTSGDLHVLRLAHGWGQSSRNHATRTELSPSMPQLPSPAIAATTARPRPCSTSSLPAAHGPPWSMTSIQA